MLRKVVLACFSLFFVLTIDASHRRRFSKNPQRRAKMRRQKGGKSSLSEEARNVKKIKSSYWKTVSKRRLRRKYK